MSTDVATLLSRNAVHLLPEEGLAEKLGLGRPLRVKMGIDVTAPQVTIGNGIPLQRMLIVGDYTTRIGDPSGRSAERPVLDPAEIDRMAESFFENATRIIDRERTEVRFNSEWLGELDFAELLRLTRTTTVAQLLERDDFSKRFSSQEPISVSELLYPLVQAYDSVAVEADVELGGTDQLYNLLTGREVMAAYGLDPQVVLTVPLARFIVRRSHGDGAAGEAERHFTRVVREGGAPEDMPEHQLPDGDPVHLPGVISAAFGISTSEARRMIAQGGVKLDGEPIEELDVARDDLDGAVLQAGKRRFARLVASG